MALIVAIHAVVPVTVNFPPAAAVVVVAVAYN